MQFTWVLAVIFDLALAGVDLEDEAGVEDGEKEVEHEADEEELSDFEPLEVEEGLAQRVLEQVVVPDLDEVHEHGTLSLGLVGDQHLEVHLQLAVDVIDVVLGQNDGVVQHILYQKPSFNFYVKWQQ